MTRFPKATDRHGASPELLAVMLAHVCPAGDAPPIFHRNEITHWMLHRWTFRLNEDDRTKLRALLDKADLEETP